MQHRRHNRRLKRGFSLVELLVAVAILVLAASITYGIFATVTKAWQRGTALSSELQHGDFIIEQVVMGLRSAYYHGGNYGFWLDDQGSGPYARDTISWVKLGTALVGKDTVVASGPHRVKLTVEDSSQYHRPGVVVRAWSPDEYLQPEDFDPAQVEPVFLSDHIVGFNCRIGKLESGGGITWEDEWENTNQLPRLLELTFYLQEPESEAEPTVMKRCVSIPVDDAVVTAAGSAGGAAAGGSAGAVITGAQTGGPR